MSAPNFRNRSPEEFKAFRPRNEDEAMAYEEESKFRGWCEENEEDPLNPDARDNYNEIQEELGDKGWANMDENDRAGWEDNMNKD
jgi:hypothetical protein